jgi:hypothetical protein
VGQVLDAKSILVFDHIPEHKAEGVFLHHFIEPVFKGKRKIGREKKPIPWIFPKDLDPPHLEHSLDRGGILNERSLDRLDLTREVLNFLLKGPDFSKNLREIHSAPTKKKGDKH